MIDFKRQMHKFNEAKKIKYINPCYIERLPGTINCKRLVY